MMLTNHKKKSKVGSRAPLLTLFLLLAGCADGATLLQESDRGGVVAADGPDALRAAILPLVSYLGPACAGLITGSLVMVTVRLPCAMAQLSRVTD